MPSAAHAATGLSSFLSPIGFCLVFLVFLYVRGWRLVSRGSPMASWRLATFLLGMVLIWAALASPLAAYDHELLTTHMIQHLLLMTFAPALVLLGQPLLVLWRGLPVIAKAALAPRFQMPFVQSFARMLTRPALCWTVSALTLVAWHTPALFALPMHFEVWHSVEQASFLAAGLLFWWPVIQPWPSQQAGPQWSILLYLFLATVPCDILSGFLVFSDRVAYPVYFSMPRRFGWSVLQDQQFAAALMWTCVTLVYLVPAVILTTRLLSPRNAFAGDLAQSELRGNAVDDEKKTPTLKPAGLPTRQVRARASVLSAGAGE